MNVVLLTLPSLILITTGTILKRRSAFGEEFWKSVEELVFYVLFPPMLFMSVVQAPFTIGGDLTYLVVLLAAMMLAVVLSAANRRLFPTVPGITHASVFQCGFRFNSYITFALCWPLLGEEGFALLALLIAVWVPVSHFLAIAALARELGGAGARAWEPSPPWSQRTRSSSPRCSASSGTPPDWLFREPSRRFSSSSDRGPS